MSLSRAEERKRASFMTVSRWIWLIVCFLVFVCVFFVVYVKTAVSDYDDERNAAIRQAKKEAGIAQTIDAVKHVWDESVWVVTGKDESGVKWFVWERKDGIVKEKAEDGLSSDDIAGRFKEAHPETDVVRVLPGWFENQPAWEIRYVIDAASERQAIDFYAFRDGTKLKTYDLPGK